MTIPSMEEVRGWGVDQVQDYLKQAGLGDCCDILLRKQVDGLALLGMNDAVLQMWSRDMKIMQIKKLSKLVSQLTSTTMPVTRINYSPAVPRQRRNISGSVGGSSENEWGSDFEDSSDTRTTTRQDMTGPGSATRRKVTADQSRLKSSKVSLNQVPKPYKPPPKSSQRIESVPASPEYSNVKKASLALKKSTISTKISTLEEKSSAVEKQTNGSAGKAGKAKTFNKGEHSKNSPISTNRDIKLESSRKLEERVESSSVKNEKRLKTLNTTVDKSKSVLCAKNQKANVANSSTNIKKKSESVNSPEVPTNNAKNSVENANISKSAPEHVNHIKPYIPPKKLAVKSTVANNSSNGLEKNAKQDKVNGKESRANLEKQEEKVINKLNSRSQLSKQVNKPQEYCVSRPDQPSLHCDKTTTMPSQNKSLDIGDDEEYYEIPEYPQTKINVEYEPGLYEEFNYKEKTNLLKKNFKYLDILGDNGTSPISDNKEVIVDEDDNEYEPIDRMDFHGGVKQSEIMSKETGKSDTDISEAAGRRIVKYVKTSNNFVKNNIEYATVKTEKISTISQSSGQLSSHCKIPGSKYLERALPQPPPEENSHARPSTKAAHSTTPAQSMSPQATPSPHTIWTPPSQRLPVKQASISLHNSINEVDLGSSIWSSSSDGCSLSLYPWYQAIDRRRAEELLKQLHKDGGFVVRDSKHGGQDSPYTLTVYNNNKVFNINIRTRPDGKIALGKEKVDEQAYPSIENMVEHHTNQPIKLTAGDTGTQHSSTTLNYWPL